MSQTGQLVNFLDIGHHKISFAVGTIDHAGKTDVIDLISVASLGLKKGKISDLEKLSYAILNAAHLVEKKAGAIGDKTYVSMHGLDAHSSIIQAQMPINQPHVDAKHIHDLSKQARKNIKPSEQLIHFWPLSYSIDEQDGIDDPYGMIGEHISGEYFCYTTSATWIKNLMNILGQCHLGECIYVSNSLAACLGSTTAEERKLGIICIDIGSAKTSFCCMQDDKPYFMDAVSVGSQHISQDLAQVLSISFKDAEKLKIKHGSVDAKFDDTASIEVQHIDQLAHLEQSTISKKTLCEIISPRLEEMFELLHEKMNTIGMPQGVFNKYVLTGGGANLQGLIGFMQHEYQALSRIGIPHGLHNSMNAECTPENTTLAGLLHYPAWTQKINNHTEPVRHLESRFLGRIRNWFKKAG